MQKENRPLIGEVSSLSEATSSKPTFVLVGSPESSPEVKQVAGAKKANLTFFWIASLENQANGTLLFVENGAVSASVPAGGDVNAFVSERAYPLVGQLTPEN